MDCCKQKILEVLAAREFCSLNCSLLAKQIFYFCSCSQKNRSARHARECSQRPFVTPLYKRSVHIFAYSCQDFLSVQSSFDGKQYLCKTCHLIQTISINTSVPLLTAFDFIPTSNKINPM